MNELAQLAALKTRAERVLGSRGWALLYRYGKLMGGASSGQYISGISVEDALEIVHALADGQTLLVHLMHKHTPGNSETSSLRFREGKLEMVFPNRVEPA